jgi:hypothetical protein
MSSNLIFDNVPRLSNEEISQLEKNIITNITALKAVQYKLSPAEYAAIMNYHNYILNSFQEMKNNNTMYAVNSYKPLNNDSMPVTKNNHQQGDWSNAFSSDLLLKPPSFIYPPKNTFQITK